MSELRPASVSPALPNPRIRTRLRRALLDWYDASARDLPWRQTSDPYRVWLSEVMLQQTRVETVIPYYHRFLQRFPTVHALAQAPLDDVLKLWEGLGYYRRARMLHACAQHVATRCAGRFPATVAALKSLPGIGHYTAAAVASIAFGARAPALDGNIKRVLARLTADPTPIDQPAGEDRFLRTAERFLPKSRVGAWNQALMDLGARICVPRRPRCLECPIYRWCAAAQTGRQGELPVRAGKKPPRPVLAVAAALHDCDRRLLVVQRPSSGLLGSLWGLPSVELHSPPDTSASRMFAAALRATLRDDLELPKLRIGKTIGVVQHTFTHRQLTMPVFAAATHHRQPTPRLTRYADYRWLPFSELGKLAIATVDHKALRLLTSPAPQSASDES